MSSLRTLAVTSVSGEYQTIEVFVGDTLETLLTRIEEKFECVDPDAEIDLLDGDTIVGPGDEIASLSDEVTLVVRRPFRFAKVEKLDAVLEVSTNPVQECMSISEDGLTASMPGKGDDDSYSSSFCAELATVFADGRLPAKIRLQMPQSHGYYHAVYVRPCGILKTLATVQLEHGEWEVVLKTGSITTTRLSEEDADGCQGDVEQESFFSDNSELFIFGVYVYNSGSEVRLLNGV